MKPTFSPLAARLSFFLILLLPFGLTAQVGINPTGADPDASAMLDVTSTDRGVLIPRMSTAARNSIVDPATGLMVYDSTLKALVIFDGVQWINAVFPTMIQDGDADTKINVEQSADGDSIHVNIGGTESMILSRSASGNVTLMEFPNNSRSVMIGRAAGRNTGNGSRNTYLGFQAGRDGSADTTSMNTFVGSQAGQMNQSMDNTFIGADAGSNNVQGGQNTFVGQASGRENTEGESNTFLGVFAGEKNRLGSRNTFVGRAAGRENIIGGNNVYIGRQAGQMNQGSDNIFIGHMAGAQRTTDNGRLFIDNSDTNRPLIWGDFSNDRLVINGRGGDNNNDRTFFVNGDAGGTGPWFNDSDLRLKEDILTIEGALDKVQRLRGVTFHWKDGRAGETMGFIAQEVEQVAPQVVDTSNDHYSMAYAPLTALLVEAVKEQQQLIDQQQQRMEAMQKENADLKNELAEIKALLKELLGKN